MDNMKSTITERGDYWHPDPEKDKKLGGPGANQRAREDRAAASNQSLILKKESRVNHIWIMLNVMDIKSPHLRKNLSWVVWV